MFRQGSKIRVSLASASRGRFRSALRLGLAILFGSSSAIAGEAPYDIVIRGGTIFDGSGGAPYVGDVAIRGDRIAFVGPHGANPAYKEIRADGLAVAPGFINMLSWANESLLADGRAQSDLRQGVTLEVMGEGQSMGPLTPPMKQLLTLAQSDVKYSVDWTTLGEYLEKLERRGIAPNVASFVGATTIRMHELGNANVDPSPDQLKAMRKLVREALEEGALGISSALIYPPGAYANTPELVALAQEAGRCGGPYITHMRSEGDRLLEAIDETLAIVKATGARAEIYHLKAIGQNNWNKLGEAVARIENARRQGVRIGANMYTYTASATALHAVLPLWVQEGGINAIIKRLKEPDTRQRVIAELRGTVPSPTLSRHLDAGGTLLLAFKSQRLKGLTGKTLAEVAKLRGVTGEDAAIDLIIEDHGGTVAAYFLMSEDNVRKAVAIPWVSFGSDETALAPEGVFLKSNVHPRAYGNFARLLGHYVRDEKLVSLPDAIRRLTLLPASNLSLLDRGALKEGYFADVVVFDPAKIEDKATYSRPHQLAIGVRDVLVNGRLALKNGKSTGVASGRVVRGRAWKGFADGGCRGSSGDWTWAAETMASTGAK